MLSSEQNPACVLEPLSIVFIKSHLDFFPDCIERIVGKADSVKFIGSNDCVGKAFFDQFMKERRQINADHRYILTFGFRICEQFVVDGDGAAIIYDVAAAPIAQIVNDDLIFCANVSAKLIYGMVSSLIIPTHLPSNLSPAPQPEMRTIEQISIMHSAISFSVLSIKVTPF